jgi:hypothetical protein
MNPQHVVVVHCKAGKVNKEGNMFALISLSCYNAGKDGDDGFKPFDALRSGRA